MPELPAEKIEPYAIDWRPHSHGGRWSRLTKADGHDEAREKAAEIRGLHGGVTRIVSQHVIEVTRSRASTRKERARV